ncbi:alkylphosphonate utilization operon protein PhnA [Acidithiobacillus sp. GGI-221]|nr:alkylphosphonate utilization operon protein PhnA [Acidithiobacillus sp. GGI-221]
MKTAIFIYVQNAHRNGQKENNLEKIDSLRVSDANGSAINDGDTVVVVKDLKIKGSSSIIKVGTK